MSSDIATISPSKLKDNFKTVIKIIISENPRIWNPDTRVKSSKLKF